MRILLTGVTSRLGRAVAADLLAAGHEVSGFALRAHPDLDPRVELTLGRLQAGLPRYLADGADTVIHLAPVEAAVPESAGLHGVVHVADAAAQAGARLVFVSQACGDPALYREAEALVSSAWGPSLVIRVAPAVGRQIDWMVARTVRTIVNSHGPATMRVLHHDDLRRFLIRAVGSHRTGAVDLATTDAVTLVTARRLLLRAGAGGRGGVAWTDPDPGYKLVPLHRQWDFECGWSAADAVADTARGLAGRRVTAAGARDTEWWSALPMESPRGSGTVTPARSAAIVLHDPAPNGVSGEFDSLIDRRFPRFSRDGYGSGPLTPVSLDVVLGALRVAQDTTSRALGLRGSVAAEWQARAVAVFGHHLYSGRSVADAAGAGQSRTHRYRNARRMLSPARRFGDRAAEFATALDAERSDEKACAGLSDAALEARIGLLRSRIQQGFRLAALGRVLEDALRGLAGGQRRPSEVFQLAATSGELAAAATVLSEEPVEECAPDPERAADTDAGVTADVTPRWAVRLADAAGTARRRCWGVTAQYLWQLRTALLERGTRLAGQRMLGEASDIFYLTCDEVLTAPIDLRLRAKCRRAENERLQTLQMPETFEIDWVPA